jgi:hypothetical protein
LKVLASKFAANKILIILVVVVTLVAIGCFEAYNVSLSVPQPSSSPYIAPSPSPSSTPLPTNPPILPTLATPNPTPLVTLAPSALPTSIPSPLPILSPTFTAYPTSQPTATPQPTSSPTPIPTHPPPGTGPSVVERTVQENSVESILNSLSPSEKSTFVVAPNATLGNWSASITYTPLKWTASARVRLGISMGISNTLLTEFRSLNPAQISNASILITAERDFDPQGNQHVPWDNTISTILTPTGLPIEGGGSAAVSRYNGYTQRGPVDIMLEVPFSNFTLARDTQWTSGKLYGSFDLPNNLPPGIYRLRLDFALKAGSRYIDFNNNTVGTRPQSFSSISCAYSPQIEASGWAVNGTWVDASIIARKPCWVLLWDYNSNGYRGVVAREDEGRVAISPRNLIHDDVILPKVNTNGVALSYNLEPLFLFENDNTQRSIPWQYKSGQWSVRITLPNGTLVNLGTANFTARRGNGATTQNASFTYWKPPIYGNYTVEAQGWIQDVWGNRYAGGGNYSFWIGERLTLATATFQGMAYNVGNRYGRDMAFNPPVPANVTVKATLLANSDPNNATTVISKGTATPTGLFGAAQGLIALPLNSPGEYFATVTATYVDPKGVLWVSAMRHAGVVYPINSSIDAHGKKLTIPGGTLVDRGETHTEGYVAPNGTLYLQHINFPYNSGDALLIASEYQGANKIEPVLTYAVKGSNATYDSGLQTIGKTNLVIKTSNNLSPEMFPEFITDKQYYYASAPRPGFNSRFIIAHDLIRAPYWPTSNNNFGGQIGASNNGDFPGDIYRLLGGVVVRTQGQTPIYAGYQASAFILPNGTKNNRVIGPGEEQLFSPDGQSARFFLVPIRPGSTYQVGATFGAVLQIDPVVPCNVTFTLTAPDNTTRVTKGLGDQYGYFAAVDKWPLDQAGVWTYSVNATWNGYQGRVPGLPDIGGWIYVLENGALPGPGITLNMTQQQTFSPLIGLNVTGRTTASKVYVAAIIPGAILEEVVLQVNNGSFSYAFDPQKMANKIKTYDVINMVNGRAEIGRVVHLTFFSEEQGTDGIIYHSFARVILRGQTAVYVRGG